MLNEVIVDIEKEIRSKIKFSRIYHSGRYYKRIDKSKKEIKE